MSRGGAKREGNTELKQLQALSSQHRAQYGAELTNREIIT